MAHIEWLLPFYVPFSRVALLDPKTASLRTNSKNYRPVSAIALERPRHANRPKEVFRRGQQYPSIKYPIPLQSLASDSHRTVDFSGNRFGPLPKISTAQLSTFPVVSRRSRRRPTVRSQRHQIGIVRSPHNPTAWPCFRLPWSPFCQTASNAVAKTSWA